MPIRPTLALATAALSAAALLSACSSSPEVVKPPVTENKPVVEEPKGPQYPATRREEIVDTIHGQQVADPYRWLEDVENDEVQAWMKAQDGFARGHIAELPGREQLTDRLKELYYVDSVSAPYKRGDHYFYTRRHADKEKAIVYWKKGRDGQEQVLLDPNKMTEERKANISVGRWVPSWDGKRVAYTIKENNADESTLYIMDVAKGEISQKDVIEGAKYASPSWTPKGDGFYYTWLPPLSDEITAAERPGFAEVRYHKLGTDPAKDPVIHPKLGDPRKFLGVSLSRDGRWLFVYKWNGWTSVEIVLRDLKNRRQKDFVPFFSSDKAQASVKVWKDNFYITTNEDAPRYKVYKTSARKLDRKHWKTLIEEPEDAVLNSIQIIGGKLVVNYLRNVASFMEVRELDGKLVREVPLPGIGASFGMIGNPDEDVAYYSFMNYTTPWQIYETSVKTGKTELWQQIELPIDPSPYEVEQVWYNSKDGTKVSMFIVRRKDMPKDGSTPLLLYGYGGFQVKMRPYFSSGLYPWLEAGGAYAVPNLRGGGEYGEQWHKDGMLLKKQNVFDDFIAAAEYLIKEGYTSADKLAIRGGSNGGLLVGAVMTQRPELYRAVVCAVPLLDMVRYHLFGSGKTWISEYGSADDPEQFKALHAYSPYHHVKADTAYPSVLFMTSTNDDRVDPLHARKMAAAVQAATSSQNPVLLRIEQQAGHGGADLIKQRVEQTADIYAFLMKELGMKMPMGATAPKAPVKAKEPTE